MTPSADEFLTVADVATILKLNQQDGPNWIDRGELPAVRVGRRVRIRRSDFERLVEGGA
jgi:excisionase family DNA binding protein